LQINIIHTPGRVDDFTVEVETALRAFDGGAIHVLCGVNGVQSHSIAVDKQMIRFQLPRLIFINNLDHKGANPWQLLNQVNSNIIIDSRFCTMFSIPDRGAFVSILCHTSQSPCYKLLLITWVF